MKWPLFENKIKKSLINHDSEIDVQDLWSGMESQVDMLNRKKKKRRAVVWFFFAGLVGLIGLISLEINEMSKEETIVLTENTPFIPHSESNVKEEKVESENEKIEASEELVSEDFKKKGDLKNGVPNLNISPHYDSDITTEKSAFESAFAGQSHIKEVRQPDIKINKSSGSFKGVQYQNQPESTEAQTEIVENDISKNIINKSKPNISSDESESADILENGPVDVEENAEKISVQSIVELSETEESSAARLSENNRKKAFNFAVSGLGGLAFTERKLESEESAFDELRGLRDRTERSLETAQFGLQLHLQHKSGLELTSGINHTQINERFRYTETVTTQDSIFGIQYFIVDLNDNIDTVWGNVPLDLTTTYNKRYYNRFKMIEVPILLGWSKKFGKVRVGGQAGIFANISMKTEGRVLTSKTEDIDVNDSEIYQTNVGLSYYFGISAGYALTDNLEIFASPYARTFAKNFGSDSYGLTQKYRLYGLNVGARFSF